MVIIRWPARRSGSILSYIGVNESQKRPLPGFKAAGDPNAFPEQIKAGLRPWKPLKMYARIPMARVTEQGVYDYATHHWAPARIYDYIHRQWLPWNISTNVQVPEGDVDVLTGLSYLQIAREGLGFQKSQNGGTGVPAAGEMTVPYHRFESYLPTSGSEESSFFDGIDTSLAGIADLVGSGAPAFLKESLGQINMVVEEAISGFRANEPVRIAPSLASALKQTSGLIERVTSSDITPGARYDVLHELRIKQAQLNTAVRLALNLMIDASIAPDRAGDSTLAAFAGNPDTLRIAIPGQQFRVSVQVNNGSDAALTMKDIRLQTPERERWTLLPRPP